VLAVTVVRVQHLPGLFTQAAVVVAHWETLEVLVETVAAAAVDADAEAVTPLFPERQTQAAVAVVVTTLARQRQEAAAS